MTAALLASTTAVTTAQQAATVAAAETYVPGVAWRAASLVAGDFTCEGRIQEAILGTTEVEIVVAVFINGRGERPEVLRYSAAMRSPRLARLAIEGLDYDPADILGERLPGFQRSKSCKGLNVSDGLVDAAHIYWNREAKRFEDWVL